MSPKKVQLFRTWEDGKQTLGAFVVTDRTLGVEFICRCLELPNMNNQNNVSCFVPGKYLCKFTKSPSFSAKAGHEVKTYEIMNVPARAGCRIHSANFVVQLHGCIALGDAHKDINADAQLDIIHSGATVEAFEKLMNYEDFMLEVIDVTD